MDMGIKVFSSILFVLILVLFLFLYHKLSNSIDHPNVNVIVRNPRLVFPPCPAAPRLQLDPAILASLPELDYAAGSMSLECSVCLSEFKTGEKIRLLPSCNHCFHIDCIDMWFHSHATCPVCRANVENFDQELGAVYPT